jgi:hypothetical protein
MSSNDVIDLARNSRINIPAEGYVTSGEDVLVDVLAMETDAYIKLYDDGHIITSEDINRSILTGKALDTKSTGIQNRVKKSGIVPEVITAYLLPNDKLGITRGQHNTIAIKHMTKTSDDQHYVIIMRILKSNNLLAPREDFLNSTIITRIARAEAIRLGNYDDIEEGSTLKQLSQKRTAEFLSRVFQDDSLFKGLTAVNRTKVLNDMISVRRIQSSKLTLNQFIEDICNFNQAFQDAFRDSLYEGNELTTKLHFGRALAVLYSEAHLAIGTATSTIRFDTYMGFLNNLAKATNGGKDVFTVEAYKKISFTGEGKTEDNNDILEAMKTKFLL